MKVVDNSLVTFTFSRITPRKRRRIYESEIDMNEKPVCRRLNVLVFDAIGTWMITDGMSDLAEPLP